MLTSAKVYYIFVVGERVKPVCIDAFNEKSHKYLI